MAQVPAVEAIVFPALGLSKDTSIVCFQNLSELLSATPVALRNEYHVGLTILDSSLHRLQASGVRVGHQSWLVRIINRPVRVAIDIAESAQISLIDAKSLVIEQVWRASDFWSAGGNIEDLVSEIMRATDFAAICAIFAGRFCKYRDPSPASGFEG